MRILCALAIFLVAATASATKPVLEKPESTQVEQQQSQGQQQVQSQSASNVAGAVVSSRALGIGSTAPDAPLCPPGLVPGKARHRGWTGLSFGVSARCTAPDDEEAKAMQEARAHELEVLRLQIELAREAQRRIAAEGELVSASGK